MKKVIITEGQKEILFINDKPSLSFDIKHGTNLSQKYDFPFGISDDMMWTVYMKCLSAWWVRGHDKEKGINSFSRSENEYCSIFHKIIDSLKFKHFPYDGVENLSYDAKKDILGGMASNLNYDDIVHFAINGIGGMKNGEVTNEINQLFPRSITDDINWVISPKTMEKMKQQITVRKLNTIDYV